MYLCKIYKNISHYNYKKGVSSGASALSRYVDSLSGNKIREYLREHLPMNVSSFAEYPDFLAFAFVLLITGKNQCIFFLISYHSIIKIDRFKYNVIYFKF